jgi:hypothetical protein
MRLELVHGLRTDLVSDLRPHVLASHTGESLYFGVAKHHDLLPGLTQRLETVLICLLRRFEALTTHLARSREQSVLILRSQRGEQRPLHHQPPYGLVPWSHIGRAVGVATPVIDSIVNLYSVLHERNWWDEGRSAEDLGLAEMSVQQIKDFVRTGRRAT